MEYVSVCQLKYLSITPTTNILMVCGMPTIEIDSYDNYYL